MVRREKKAKNVKSVEEHSVQGLMDVRPPKFPLETADLVKGRVAVPSERRQVRVAESASDSKDQVKRGKPRGRPECSTGAARGAPRG